MPFGVEKRLEYEKKMIQKKIVKLTAKIKKHEKQIAKLDKMLEIQREKAAEEE